MRKCESRENKNEKFELVIMIQSVNVKLFGQHQTPDRETIDKFVRKMNDKKKNQLDKNEEKNECPWKWISSKHSTKRIILTIST